MGGRYNLRQSTRIGKIKKQSPRGSPRDQIPRVPIILEELDLQKSHVKSNQVSTKQRKPERKRSWARWAKGKSLTDPSKLPKGWHMNEEDLEIDDIEGQIKRCHERIAENIMPDVFEQRLKEYTLAKVENEEKRMAVFQKYPGSEELTPDVIERLHELEAMKTDLEIVRGPSSQVPNINAIVKAYRSRKLTWTPGSITYWSNGVQICEPRAFDWDEFETINSEHRKDGAFWTEGLYGPGPEQVYPSLTLGMSPHYRNQTGVKLALRVPNVPWFAELDFIHDTGCTIMALYKNDIKTIMGTYFGEEAFEPPVIGTTRSRSSTNEVRTRECIEIEVTMLDRNRQRMTAWTRVPCAISDGSWTPNAVPRLDGPIVRDFLYTATAPDSQRLLYLANSTDDLLEAIPALDLAKNPPSLSKLHKANFTKAKATPSKNKKTTKKAAGERRVGDRRVKTMPLAAPGAPPSV